MCTLFVIRLYETQDCDICSYVSARVVRSHDMNEIKGKTSGLAVMHSI